MENNMGEVVYESIDGKRGIRLERCSDGFQLLTMRNGFQWSGMPVDRDFLLRMHAAIETVLADAFAATPSQPGEAA